MPKLTACYSKKLPTGQYSNDTFSASIEADIPASDAAAIQAGLRRLFALAKQAVDEQFNAAPAATSPTASRPQAAHQNAPPARNGAVVTNGRHVPATPSQRKAVFAICKSLGHDHQQYGIDGLSVKEASALIDDLKRQQSGN